MTSDTGTFTQIDLRCAPSCSCFNGTRTSINFEFCNVVNWNSVLTENNVYRRRGASQASLPPRIFKLSDQFDF